MHRALRYTLAVVCLILCGVVGSTVLILNSIATPAPADEPVELSPTIKNDKVNVLILGTDAGLLPGGIKVRPRTDTMMVASFDPNTPSLEVKLLSLPRDSRVVIPGRPGLDKINAAHAKEGGLQLAVDTVQVLLDLPIHYYVRVDHAGFRRVIDAIGGVDYYVESDMDWDDPYQDLYIHLKQGPQNLDGEKAEQYVRYRGNGSDITRIQRQQKFLLATLKTVLKPSNLFRINQLVDIARQSVTTNIDADDILRYLPLVDKINDKSLNTYTAPGTVGTVEEVSYWLIDHDELNGLLQEHFWDELQGDPSTITVAIEDASGANLGARAKEVLERRGFNVVSLEIASETLEKTKITAHNSFDAAGLMVYQVLRQGVLYSEKPAHATNVTITIGTDFSR